MLTIKHIRDDGRESVVSVASVGFSVEENELVGYGTQNPNEEARVASYRDGHAFVMNDQGKTVAAYNLRPNLGARKQEQKT